MSKRLVPIALGLCALLLLAAMLAWFDGGREDLREITVPVSVPEQVS